LAKADGINWPILIPNGETQRAGPSQFIQPSASEIAVDRPKPKRKNWDSVVDEEEEESKDPVSIPFLREVPLPLNIHLGSIDLRRFLCLS